MQRGEKGREGNQRWSPVREKRHDRQGRDKRTSRGGRQTCKAVVTGETDDKKE